MPSFYALTLQKAQSINCAIYGNFTAPKAQELLVSRGKTIQLLRPSEGDGKLGVVLTQEVFGLVRCLAPLRLVGSTKDMVIMTSDSGRIVVLDYKKETNSFEKVHMETYGKTGCRRIVPGEYCAVDPRGRACMIAAVEKQKFVYIFNRDSLQRLTISSPLEAHKSHTLVYALAALDVKFDNPMFCTLELSYEEADADPDAEAPRLTLTMYEMDLGVNHVFRKYAEEIDPTAHALIAVPGPDDGPGGVIVCCENVLRYRRHDGAPEVSCALPRRLEMGDDRGLMVICHATHRIPGYFFFLVQSDYGDLYKVTLTYTGPTVTAMQVQYFDTLPLCQSICVMRTGWLFAASEASDHCLYKFQGVGDDPSDPSCTSTHPEGERAFVAFSPRPLRNLLPFDVLSSLSPVTDLKAMDAVGDGSSCQLYALCGRGPRSSLRILKHGVGVVDHAASDIPGRPSGIWTLRDRTSTQDRHIVLSFADVTWVLEVGDEIRESTTTGLISTSPSLLVQVMGDNSKVQVLPDKIRHVMKARVNEWRVAAGKTIVKADANERQIVIATSGGEVTYLEVDDSHTLVEVMRREMGCEVACVSVQPLPQGRTRADFVVVGLSDNSVRVLALEKERALRQLSAQALQGFPETVSLIDLRCPEGPASAAVQALCLGVGLADGFLVRSKVDPVAGSLSDYRAKYLGAAAVRLQRITIEGGRPALLALGSKPWLCHSPAQGSVQVLPLVYERLEYAAPFNAQICGEGFVAIGKTGTLKILGVDKINPDTVFSEQRLPLAYTPRRLLPLPPCNMAPGQAIRIMLAITEADHNAYNEETKREIKAQLRSLGGEAMEVEDGGMDAIGSAMAGQGKWGSCLRVVDPINASTVFKLDLDVDECAVSITVCYFYQLKDNRPCLVVGTAQNMTLHPRRAQASWIKTYLYDENWHLQLIHSTPVEDVPISLFPFQVGYLNYTRFECGFHRVGC